MDRHRQIDAEHADAACEAGEERFNESGWSGLPLRAAA
jgi:hypothetical protein